MAEDLNDSLTKIESEWASIYYTTPKNKKAMAYVRLLDKTNNLVRLFPTAAEPIFWQAVVKASYAEQQDAFSALAAIHEVRDLLIKAININPKTMSGSAYVTLGTLYYRVPKWPISFGDDVAAKKMLETALEINPDGIDTNYFYGEYLMLHDKPDEALLYFKKALAAPSRTEQLYADNQLKAEVEQALKATLERGKADKGMFLSLFGTMSTND